jgi:environmental stress-induced protein Ves
MAISRINFGEWTPDQPGITNGLRRAENVYSKLVGYGALPTVVNYSNSASENLNNVVAGKTTAGATSVFAGGSTKLFKLDSGTLNLNNVSKSGNYTTPTDQRFRFTQFGNVIVAANGFDKLQGFNLNSSSLFANLAADAPEARYVTVVRDFVVSGYQSSYQNRVQWSALGDESSWTASATTQADFQDIPDGGSVVGVTGGEFGLILMDRSIHRMVYVGSPLIFQFDNISRNLGCYEANSVIQYGGTTFFLGDDGFYACDGQNVVPIGNEKVNRFFFDNVDEGTLYLMSAAVDPTKKLIIWAYASNSSATADSLLIYNYQTQRWTSGTTHVDRIASTSTPAVTLEGMDVYGNLDTILTTFDSRLWLGGRLQLAGVDGAKIVTFSGANATAYIETGDIEVPGSTSSITLVKPTVEGGSGSVALLSRRLLTESTVFGSQTAADAENRVSVRGVGRYHRLQLTPTGSWTSAVGIDIDLSPLGTR